MQTESKGQEALLVLVKTSLMPLRTHLATRKANKCRPKSSQEDKVLHRIDNAWLKRHAIHLRKLLTMSTSTRACHQRCKIWMVNRPWEGVCLALHWFGLLGQCCWLKVLIPSLEGYFSVAALQLFLHGPLHLLQRQTNDLSDKTPPISWIHETRSW